MAKIKTFELDRWSEPDEKRRVRHIGMADAKETFDRLQTHLELKGLLPDEYFLFSDELTGELPEFDQALCIPNFGANEGIYLDISLACRDKDGKRYFQNFATGKTLGETADDYYRMFRIAAECSLMLNGRGNTYEQKKVDIVLTEQEAEAVGTVVDMELCGHHPPEAEAILNSALEKIDRIAFAKVQTITCHGKDDYSLWSAEIPKDMLHSILHEACERVGTLDELMDAMNPKDGYEMRLRSTVSLNGSPIWRTTPMRAALSEEQRTKSWRRFLPSGRPPKKIWKMTLNCDSPHFSFHLYLPAPLRGRPATGIRRPRPAVLG